MPAEHNQRNDDAAAAADPAAISAFLRALAGRVERDPAFGREIAALLAESGLLVPTASPSVPGKTRRGHVSRPHDAETPTAPPPDPLPDPFALLRERGEEQLRERLDALDLAALRQMVRAHRLDPARISARWSNRERLIALIVDQVRVRADHGKAFSRV